MKRAKTKLIATSGLLAAGLVMTPFLAASADQTPAGAGAVESNSLAANEQAQAATSASALGLASGEKLTVKAVIEDADGGRHVRYQRTLDGLRVIGGDLVAHKEAKGTVTDVTYNLGRKSIAPRRGPRRSPRRPHRPRASPRRRRPRTRRRPGASWSSSSPTRGPSWRTTY